MRQYGHLETLAKIPRDEYRPYRKRHKREQAQYSENSQTLVDIDVYCRCLLPDSHQLEDEIRLAEDEAKGEKVHEWSVFVFCRGPANDEEKEGYGECDPGDDVLAVGGLEDWV